MRIQLATNVTRSAELASEAMVMRWARDLFNRSRHLITARNCLIWSPHVTAAPLRPTQRHQYSKSLQPFYGWGSLNPGWTQEKLPVFYMLAPNSLHLRKSVWAGHRMKSLRFEVARLSVTAIDSFREPLSSVFQFLPVHVHDSHTGLVIVKKQ